MNKKFLFHLFTATKSELLMKISLALKYCINPPYIIGFVITERCNASCNSCDLWKDKNTPELSTQECKNIILQLRHLTAHSAINFNGGEPFTKSDFYEILGYANRLGFYTTVTSNGLSFDKDGCDKTLNSGVDYINFSVASIDPEIHDNFRGVSGAHSKIISAVRYIKEINKRVKICFSSFIAKDNYKALNDFTEWALSVGADIVDFSPVLSNFGHNVRIDGPALASRSNPLSKLDDLSKFDKQLDLLINKKRKGFPLVTPIDYLNKIRLYYRDQNMIAPKKICRTSFKIMNILTNGDVKLCFHYPAIGNIRKDDIKDIWFGDTAQKQRKEMLKCRIPCMCSVFREYNLPDKFSILLARAGFRFKQSL